MALSCAIDNDLGIKSWGNDKVSFVTGTFSGTYATGGVSVDAGQCGLADIRRMVTLANSAGYDLDYSPSTDKILIYVGGSGTTGSTSGGTPAGTNSTSAVTGTAAAQTFTGTASTTAEVTAFSGTGQTSAGQVITTTDNQTMTLNQCAGMWFVSDTHGPWYIASNTAVTGAPAVLTVLGDAPVTDAGAYVIVKAPTPAGTNAASASLTATAAAQTFTGSALAGHTHSISATAESELANGAAISFTATFICIGK